MERLQSGDFCPQCHIGTLSRIHRKFWMRLLPFSGHFYCEFCHARFLTSFLGRSFQVGKGGWGWWKL